MFDNLREQANSKDFQDEDLKSQSDAGPGSLPRRSSAGKLLGMTAQQRFFITFMIMIMVCVLGTMCLLVTGRFGLF